MLDRLNAVPEDSEEYKQVSREEDQLTTTYRRQPVHAQIKEAKAKLAELEKKYARAKAILETKQEECNNTLHTCGNHTVAINSGRYQPMSSIAANKLLSDGRMKTD